MVSACCLCRLMRRSVATGPGLMPSDADAVGVRGAAERPREGHQARVGGAARDVGRVHLLAGRADDVDDDAALLLFHGRIDRARQVDIAEHLQVPGLAPGVFVHFQEVAAGNGAGVVDEDVEVSRPCRELFCCAALRNIDGFRRGARCNIARGAEHRASFARKELDAGAADTLGRAGDQDAFALKIEFHGSLV